MNSLMKAKCNNSVNLKDSKCINFEKLVSSLLNLPSGKGEIREYMHSLLFRPCSDIQTTFFG